MPDELAPATVEPASNPRRWGSPGLGLLLARLASDAAARREASGIDYETVSDTAAVIGCARSFLYQLQKGERNPSPVILGKLLDHYGASDDDRKEAWRMLAIPPERG